MSRWPNYLILQWNQCSYLKKLKEFGIAFQDCHTSGQLDRVVLRRLMLRQPQPLLIALLTSVVHSFHSHLLWFLTLVCAGDQSCHSLLLGVYPQSCCLATDRLDTSTWLQYVAILVGCAPEMLKWVMHASHVKETTSGFVDGKDPLFLSYRRNWM